MSWPSLFIGIAIGLTVAGTVWALVSSHRALKDEDAARAAPADQPERDI